MMLSHGESCIIVAGRNGILEAAPAAGLAQGGCRVWGWDSAATACGWKVGKVAYARPHGSSNLSLLYVMAIDDVKKRTSHGTYDGDAGPHEGRHANAAF